MGTSIPSNKFSILVTSEREQSKDVIYTRKREIENMEIDEVYEFVPDMGHK